MGGDPRKHLWGTVREERDGGQYRGALQPATLDSDLNLPGKRWEDRICISIPHQSGEGAGVLTHQHLSVMGPGLFYGLDFLGHSPPPGQAEQALRSERVPSRDTWALANGHKAVRRLGGGGQHSLIPTGLCSLKFTVSSLGTGCLSSVSLQKKEYMLLHLILPKFVGKSQAGSSSDLFPPN